MLYLTNGLSVHMLEDMCEGDFRDLRISRISHVEAQGILRSNAFKSYFGHKDSAEILEKVLRVDIPYNRNLLRLRKGDIMIIATLCSGTGTGPDRDSAVQVLFSGVFGKWEK